MAELVQTRVVTLAEVPAMVDFMFLDDAPIDADAWSKTFGSADAVGMLGDAIAAYSAPVDWTAESLKSTLETVGAARGLKLGKAQAPVRVAVTGRTVGPPLFEALELLGRDETLRRLAAAAARLET
jgi:glutamyl-tRNA synthetase